MSKGTPCLLIDKQTGEVAKRYGSVKEAAYRNNLSWCGAWTQMTERSLPEGRCMLRLEQDWQGFEVFGAGKLNRPVLLTDGERWKWTANAREAAQLLGMESMDWFYHAMAGGLKVRGLRAKYADSTLEWGMIRQMLKEKARQGEKGQQQ